MKVKSVAKALKEYDSLQGLIKSIESYVKDFEKIEKSEDDLVVYINGSFTINGSPVNKNERRIDVTVRSEVADLIRDDVVNILKEKLVELKKERDKLEL